MTNKLLVAVLGNRNSGKSSTWYNLFDAKVKTGSYQRALYLNKAQYVEVFLINGSPEERGIPVKDLLPENEPTIVLCSVQYIDTVKDTFEFFHKNNFEIFVQWLNPGYDDSMKYSDELGLSNHLLNIGATLQLRDGQGDLVDRVREIRQTILGWASYRNLVITEF